MKKNIKYQTKNISDYFSQNRVKWNQFYESEKIVIEEIGIKHHLINPKNTPIKTLPVSKQNIFYPAKKHLC